MKTAKAAADAGVRVFTVGWDAGGIADSTER